MSPFLRQTCRAVVKSEATVANEVLRAIGRTLARQPSPRVLVNVTPGIAQNAVTKNTPIEGTSYHAADIADTSVTEKNYNCKHMYGIDYSKAGEEQRAKDYLEKVKSLGKTLSKEMSRAGIRNYLFTSPAIR